MTRVVWEHHQQTPLFEDIVAVLLSRLHPTAERIDGSGGDGGRDVQIRSPGRLDVFEIKSFTGRLSNRSPDRRSQVEKSLRTAAALQPDSWTLVVPINHNDSELEWFDGLRESYGFPLSWNDRDWLDGQMAAFPDIRRYYLEGAADEVLRLQRELLREDEPLTSGVEDAISRLRRLRERLNDIDPQYRFEVSPGPAAAATIAFPNAVMYHQEGRDDEEPWTVSILAKYRDAPRDRPIQISGILVFDESTEGNEELRAQYIEMMEYGSDEPVVLTDVRDLVIDAPGGLSGAMPAGTLYIGSIPKSITLKARLEVSEPGGRPLASVPVTFTRGAAGVRGMTFYGADNTGVLTVRLQIDEEDSAGAFRFAVNPVDEYSPSELLPILRLLDVMTEPNLANVVANRKRVNDNPMALPDTRLVEPTFVALVEAIARLQAETKTFFRVQGDLTARDVAQLGRLMLVIDGGQLPVEVPDGIDFVTWQGVNPPPVGKEYATLAKQVWQTESFVGHDIPVGPCVFFGGPWTVTDVQPEDESFRVFLAPTPDARWVVQRGSLVPDPPGPNDGGRMLFPPGDV